VQALAQQYHHSLSSCVARLQLPQQPVTCSKHSRSSIVRCNAAGAASTDVEAAAEATQQQEQQQQSSSKHLVIDMDDSQETNGNAASSSGPDVVVKTLSAAEELQAVARLRAEAYYAVSTQRGDH
jgi:non-canonical (house-cleaning) NTP pyrophosphatase